MIRQPTLIILTAIALGLATFSPAQQASAAQPSVYTGIVRGVAVGGYDPVAYFKNGKPVKGSKQFTLRHKGATWHFTSAANRDAFKAGPANYAPQ